MNPNHWLSDRSTDRKDSKKRELEIQKSCNQRRIAEIERDSTSLTTDAKSRLRPGQGTIIPYQNPHSGKQEFFLIEASRATEFMRLQEEKECLQKRVEEIDRELTRTPLEMPTKATDRKERNRSPQTERNGSKDFPFDLPDSPLRYDTTDPSGDSSSLKSAATEQASGSGFGTLLAFLTAIGLTLLLL